MEYSKNIIMTIWFVIKDVQIEQNRQNYQLIL